MIFNLNLETEDFQPFNTQNEIAENKALHDEEGSPSLPAAFSSVRFVSSLTTVSSVGSPSRVNAVVLRLELRQLQRDSVSLSDSNLTACADDKKEEDS